MGLVVASSPVMSLRRHVALFASYCESTTVYSMHITSEMQNHKTVDIHLKLSGIALREWSGVVQALRAGALVGQREQVDVEYSDKFVSSH